jgi:hypothetical protein
MLESIREVVQTATMPEPITARRVNSGASYELRNSTETEPKMIGVKMKINTEESDVMFTPTWYRNEETAGRKKRLFMP